MRTIVIRGRGSMTGSSAGGGSGGWVHLGMMRRWVIWSHIARTRHTKVALCLLLKVDSMLVRQRAPFALDRGKHVFLESDRTLSVALLRIA